MVGTVAHVCRPTFTPGKDVATFRKYHTGAAGGWDAVVENHYRLMRSNQTLAFSERMVKKYASFDKARMTIREAFEALKGYVDSSGACRLRRMPPY